MINKHPPIFNKVSAYKTRLGNSLHSTTNMLVSSSELNNSGLIDVELTAASVV